MIVLFKICNFYIFIQNPILKRNIKVIGSTEHYDQRTN